MSEQATEDMSEHRASIARGMKLLTDGHEIVGAIKERARIVALLEHLQRAYSIDVDSRVLRALDEAIRRIGARAMNIELGDWVKHTRDGMIRIGEVTTVRFADDSFTIDGCFYAQIADILEVRKPPRAETKEKTP